MVASIGEPWDFESEAGEGKLAGQILTVSEEREWILCEVRPFEVAGQKITRVLASRRYLEDRGGKWLRDLCRGRSVGANLFYRLDGEPIDPAQVPTAEETSFLIGSIRLWLPENKVSCR